MQEQPIRILDTPIQYEPAPVYRQIAVATVLREGNTDADWSAWDKVVYFELPNKGKQ